MLRPSSGSRARVTHIAAGTTVQGTITGATELVVDGAVNGQVVLDERVTVGPEGFVEGEMEARVVRVAGRVRGNIRGRERVEVLSSGTLEGDVVAPRMVIAEGAFFKGRVEMKEGSGQGSPKSAAVGELEPKEVASPGGGGDDAPAAGRTPRQPGNK